MYRKKRNFFKKRFVKGRGLRYLRPFAPECKHVQIMKAHKELSYRYGGQKYFNDTYQLIDILSLKDTTYNENLWEFMQEQYKKYIINKVRWTMFYFNITYRDDCDSKGQLEWGTPNDNYPFYRGVFHEFQNRAGEEGYYVKSFRSRVETDVTIKLHDASNAFRHHIYPFGFPGRKRRTFSLVYYPRCTKTVDTGVSNMPFANTIGQILAKMSPKGETYFRVGVGYGPFNTEVLPEANNGYLAREVIISFEIKCYIEMTFSEKKTVNQIQ